MATCGSVVQEQVPRFGIQRFHCAHFAHPLHGLSWFWESQSVGHLSADISPGGVLCLLLSADGNRSSMPLNWASLQEVIKSNCFRPREA